MKGYLVRYRRHHVRGDGLPASGLPATDETTVVFGVHPLVWANTPPDVYRRHCWDEVIGWQEFDDPDGEILASFDDGVMSCHVADENDETVDFRRTVAETS